MNYQGLKVRQWFKRGVDWIACALMAKSWTEGSGVSEDHGTRGAAGREA